MPKLEAKLRYIYAWTCVNACYPNAPQIWTALEKPAPVCAVCLEPMWRDTCAEDDHHEKMMHAAIAEAEPEMADDINPK